MSHKQSVLAAYKQILRLAANWEAINPKNTIKEKEYICNEANKLFRANLQVNFLN